MINIYKKDNKWKTSNLLEFSKEIELKDNFLQ